jgi:autotransporter-associated beta strand protein
MMRVTLRGRQAVLFAAVGSVSLVFGGIHSAYGQQSPTDPIVLQTASDANSATSTSFNTGGHWGASTPAGVTAGTTPTPGYAYVDTGYQLRTPASTTSSTFTFVGDSLTLIPTTPLAGMNSPSTGIGAGNNQTAYFDLKGNTTSSTINVNDLVLANGGVVQNFANDDQILTGNIYLVPFGTTLDGITTTVSGGMLDTHGNNLSGAAGTTANPTNYFQIQSNISGGGMLRIVNTGGAPTVAQVITLSGNNTYTGGTVLDNTSTFSGANTAGNSPDLAIDSLNALGTGPLTILTGTGNTTLLYSPNTGPTIDNLSGVAEILSTINAQNWNGNFVFAGSSPLEMGGGATITLGANVSLDVAKSTLTEDGPITGGFSFSKAGAGTLVLNGAGSYSGSTNVSAGTLYLGPLGSTGLGLTTVTAGTLAGIGAVDGPLSLTGGFLAPGSTLPGELTVDGMLSMGASSTLDILLTGSGSDELLDLGQASLGGNLSISVAAGFTPALGSTFTIIDDTSTLPATGVFANDLGGIIEDTSGNFYDISYASTVDGDGVANDVVLTAIAPVPEPVSAGSIACATITLISRRRARSV